MPLGLPKLSSEPVLFLPLWLGTLRDYSGYGNHIFATSGGHWTQNGCTDGTFDSKHEVSTAPLLHSPDSTFFFGGNFDTQVGTEYFAATADFVNRFYVDATALRYRVSGVTSTLVADITGSASYAVSSVAASKPEFFIDGVSAGLGNNAVSTATAASDWWFTSAFGGGVVSLVSLVLKYPSALSAPEIAQLHTYSQSRFTPRKQWPGGGLRYPDRGDPYTPATGDPMYLDNIQTARVTLANQTSGQLSNTGLDIASGTFALREDATGRYIYCVGAGSLRRHLLGADTYTTKLLTATGATITKDATGFDLDFGTGDILRAVQLTAP